MRNLLAAAASVIALTACATVPATEQVQTQSAAPVVAASSIEAHIRFLADDLLEGREAGERGYDIAAAYMESQFRLIGLEPGGMEGYRAPVPLQVMSANQDEASFILNGEALNPGQDFVVSAHAVLDDASVDADAVFVGFGLDAPQLGFDDYEGLDVEGKIVVVLMGTPGELPSDISAHLNSSRTKAQYAADNGAIGMISVMPEGLSRFTFERMAPYAAGESMTTEAASAAAELQVRAAISDAVATRLFEAAGQDYAAMVEAAINGEAPEGFDLNQALSISAKTEREMVYSDNVVGVLPGSDPALADEPVIVTAHLDHVGICRLEEEVDRICNGALDNASGSAIMIETARAMAEMDRPRRPVVFIGLTAEEKGLLGSAHIAANITPAMEGMVANVNLDMPVIRYEFNDLIAFGAEHSSLGPIAEAAVQGAGASLSPDPMPQQALFVRSDHYNFVRQGVPSVFLMTGFSSPNPDDDEGQGFLNFLGGDYHAPGDEADAGVMFDQGAKFANINLAIIDAIANADETPHWNEDSFFAQ
ncbi:M28 family metallopeptidase [Oceanicaulis sp. LC35]|uniref:M28 family metallopeptidase n=1 Tax=Oceanicaulis sp. LC35 TaxID=3349635 RepID=UPI003F873410